MDENVFQRVAEVAGAVTLVAMAVGTVAAVVCILGMMVREVWDWFWED